MTLMSFSLSQMVVEAKSSQSRSNGNTVERMCSLLVVLTNGNWTSSLKKNKKTHILIAMGKGASKEKTTTEEKSHEDGTTKKPPTQSDCKDPSIESKDLFNDSDEFFIISDGGGSKVKPVTLKWEHGGKDVFVAGSFNEWKLDIKLKKKKGVHEVTLDLPPGTHEYKYHIDGKWIHNDKQKTVNDDYGGSNNVIAVE
ncbi:5'-AMP-activated protein kinase subunit beta-2-like isoform X2 [Hydractinia symbiolongicarpus]|uniref:5'-AMP-activated protein kinase subunit beta-2-like isoform X2 n=1 Tax=Hydractinia symbiolongicarpus TaxID=13093 RepID=UPI00254C2EAA|nr:5'-AMP-activated protein kinase subunit beta-2-like isoform X2 [Hydractinia symbiolongicarpus]